jgi:hypothetical protein
VPEEIGLRAAQDSGQAGLPEWIDLTVLDELGSLDDIIQGIAGADHFDVHPVAQSSAAAQPRSPLGSLVFRPAVRSRNAIAYFAIRSWRTSTKRADLAAFRAEKASPSPVIVEAAASEVSALVQRLFGEWWGTVSNVACGHSRSPECWGKQLARTVAKQLRRPFVQLFADRFVSGSSHPKEFDRLPPLVLVQKPEQPILLVDDVATSGWHLEEAAGVIRQAGVPILPMAWIGGSISE